MVNPSTSASDSDIFISNSAGSISEGITGGVQGNWERSDSSDSGSVMIMTAYDSNFLQISLGHKLQL